MQSKREQKGANNPSRSNLTTLALLRLYWPQLLLHSFWVIVEIGIRCVSTQRLLDGFLGRVGTTAAWQYCMRWLRSSCAGHTASTAGQLMHLTRVP